MRTYPRAAFAVFALCMMVLAGCASHRERPQPARSASTPPQPAPSGQAMPPTATSNGQLPPAPDGMVGVPACDQYLSTYQACHRAAGIFAPGQIEAHYELMRGTLLRDARDPVKRATLDQRCRALSRQLQQALHGKSCYPAPASSASSG